MTELTWEQIAKNLVMFLTIFGSVVFSMWGMSKLFAMETKDPSSARRKKNQQP